MPVLVPARHALQRETFRVHGAMFTGAGGPNGSVEMVPKKAVEQPASMDGHARECPVRSKCALQYTSNVFSSPLPLKQRLSASFLLHKQALCVRRVVCMASARSFIGNRAGLLLCFSSAKVCVA